MLKQAFAGLSLMLLAGCTVAPAPPRPVYYPPGKPGYAEPAQEFSYYDDQPVYMVDGAPVWIIYEPAYGWGWWGPGRRWYSAPPHWVGRLEGRHPRGHGLPPPVMLRPAPPMGPQFVRPAGPPPGAGFRPPPPGPGVGPGAAPPHFAPAAAPRPPAPPPPRPTKQCPASNPRC